MEIYLKCLGLRSYSGELVSASFSIERIVDKVFVKNTYSDGQVIGPLKEEEANELLARQPDSFKRVQKPAHSVAAQEPSKPDSKIVAESLALKPEELSELLSKGSLDQHLNELLRAEQNNGKRKTVIAAIVARKKELI